MQLSAGVRYNDDIRAGTCVSRVLCRAWAARSSVTPIRCLQVRTNYWRNKKHFHNTSPHLSVTYKITDDVSAYATYSEGYKSGGFDMRGDAFLTPSTANGYGPENIRSYEVGLKGSFFDQRLALNLAAFLEPYKNVQVTVQTAATPPAVGIASVVANAGSAQIEGFEAEGHAAIWGPLSANFSVGLADANFKHTALLTASGIVDFALVPKWTGNFQLDYVVPHVGLRRRAGRERSGVVPQQNLRLFGANSRCLTSPAYTLFDANVNWTSSASDWVIGLHAKNLTDERYRIAAYYLPGALYGDTQTGFYGDPRTVLFSVQYRY